MSRPWPGAPATASCVTLGPGQRWGAAGAGRGSQCVTHPSSAGNPHLAPSDLPEAMMSDPPSGPAGDTSSLARPLRAAGWCHSAGRTEDSTSSGKAGMQGRPPSWSQEPTMGAGRQSSPYPGSGKTLFPGR